MVRFEEGGDLHAMLSPIELTVYQRVRLMALTDERDELMDNGKLTVEQGEQAEKLTDEALGLIMVDLDHRQARTLPSFAKEAAVRAFLGACMTMTNRLPNLVPSLTEEATSES